MALDIHQPLALFTEIDIGTFVYQNFVQSARDASYS